MFAEARELDVRIFYKIVEYETLLDSSNMTEVEWIKISEDIMVSTLFPLLHENYIISSLLPTSLPSIAC